MKRTFKTIFCVLTICAMASFNGCGKKDDAGKKTDTGGETTSTDAGADKDK